jgi:hypothetical protein
LIASDGATYDYLGNSVAVSPNGSLVAAGAEGATMGGHTTQGAVYLFRKRQGGWANTTEVAKLTASNGAQGDGLGCSVAISADGSAVAAGAQTAAAYGGAVFVFSRPQGGWVSGTQ